MAVSGLRVAAWVHLADTLAFALRFEGRNRVHNADEIVPGIVAKRLVEHLERSGFIVMKRPPIDGVRGDSSTDHPGDTVQGRIIKS
jgi:hypothetical protein